MNVCLRDLFACMCKYALPVGWLPVCVPAAHIFQLSSAKHRRHHTHTRTHYSAYARQLSFIDECEFYVLCIEMCRWLELWRSSSSLQTAVETCVHIWVSWFSIRCCLLDNFTFRFIYFSTPAAFVRFTSCICNRSSMYSQQKRNKVSQLYCHPFFIFIHAIRRNLPPRRIETTVPLCNYASRDQTSNFRIFFSLCWEYLHQTYIISTYDEF